MFPRNADAPCAGNLAVQRGGGLLAGAARLRVTTEQRDVQLIAPYHIYVPAAG
jgi:hypothetical protein